MLFPFSASLQFEHQNSYNLVIEHRHNQNTKNLSYFYTFTNIWQVVCRFGQIFGILFTYQLRFKYTKYLQNKRMRKQIIFEQSSAQTCTINVRNIFGFSINYVDDKIKKNGGKWNKRMRKFEVPLTQVPQLAKELQSIDRAYYIEQVPSIIADLINKYSSLGIKVKKQILIDANIVRRYSYIQQNVLKNIIQTSKTQNLNKNYHKIMIICPEIKILTWMDNLQSFNSKILNFQPKQPQTCLSQDAIWICSYQLLWNKSEQINKYCFQTIIIDQAQILSSKIGTQQSAAVSFRKFLHSRHFVFPIISKLYLNRLQILIPLLSIVLPQTNFSWLQRRYKKQNLTQLYFVIKSCGLGRDINESKDSKSNYAFQSKHYFNKLLLTVSEQGVEKIKLLNKKSNQIQYRKLLQNPVLAKNKNEKSYMESMMQILQHQKLESIYKQISYFCIELKLKLAIIIESNAIYRSLQNFLCEHQISYCHYEHHQQVIEFNKNPTTLVCLVKNEYLINVDFNGPLCTNDQIVNNKLQNYQPQQYLCLSGVTNIIFPDIDWVVNAKQKQQSIRQLFAGAHRDIVRHYFILKGTYEEKWYKYMEEYIMKIQMNLRVKQDLMQEQQLEIEGGKDDNFDQTFAFCQLNLAQVQQEYSHLKTIKGVTDIDEQFDRLEFQALQQKLQRESKKKVKLQKVKEKQKQKLQDLLFQSNKKSTQSNNKNIKQKETEKDDQEQFEIFLMKLKKQQQIKLINQQQNKVNIYEPITQSEQSKINKQNKSEQKCKILIKTVTSMINSTKNQQQMQQKLQILQPTNDQQVKNSINSQKYKQQLANHLNEDQTDEVEIIEVKKAPKKPKLVKSKPVGLRVILRPNLGNLAV